jgi:hypothetical protein
MTEYISKEEAEKIAVQVGFIPTKGAKNGHVEYLRRAINLAIAQKFEVVGYGVLASNTMKVSSFLLADHPEAEERFDYKPEHILPLYALKGDSK